MSGFHSIQIQTPKGVYNITPDISNSMIRDVMEWFPHLEEKFNKSLEELGEYAHLKTRGALFFELVRESVDSLTRFIPASAIPEDDHLRYPAETDDEFRKRILGDFELPKIEIDVTEMSYEELYKFIKDHGEEFTQRVVNEYQKRLPDESIKIETFVANDIWRTNADVWREVTAKCLKLKNLKEELSDALNDGEDVNTEELSKRAADIYQAKEVLNAIKDL